MNVFLILSRSASVNLKSFDKTTQNALQPRLLLDMCLLGHVDELLDLIADRIVTQYFAPYCVVDLARMGQAIQIISNDQLSARIDPQTNTLHRRSQDVRQATLQRVACLSKVHTSALKRDILRLSLIQQNFIVGETEGGDQSQQSQQVQMQMQGGYSGYAAGSGAEGLPLLEWVWALGHPFMVLWVLDLTLCSISTYQLLPINSSIVVAIKTKT